MPRMSANCASRSIHSRSTQPLRWTFETWSLADRAVVRLLREFVDHKRIVLRNCPAYIRIWMAAEEAD